MLLKGHVETTQVNQWKNITSTGSGFILKDFYFHLYRNTHLLSADMTGYPSFPWYFLFVTQIRCYPAHLYPRGGRDLARVEIFYAGTGSHPDRDYAADPHIQYVWQGKVHIPKIYKFI